MKTAEKKYSVTIKIIEELANDKGWLEAFKKVANEQPELKAPTALAVAKMIKTKEDE